MNMHKKQIALVVSLALPSIAFAADNCSGYYVESVTSTESSEFSKGNTLSNWRETSIVVTDDANNPINMSAGDCTGVAVGTADGKVEAGGLCTRKDKDGDIYSYR